MEMLDPRYSELNNIDWNFSDAVQDALSSIHPYPARFISDIPRELIKILGCEKNSIVFDPFCGSGTTLIEAQRAGYDAVGVDLNPIACLISRVKVNCLPKDFLSIANNVCASAKVAYDGSVEIPVIPNLDHWFKADIQKALSSILQQIAFQTDTIIKEALRLALSSIIVRVSNQESDTRYAAVYNNYIADDVFKCFISACNKLYYAKQENVTSNSLVKIIHSDILRVAPNDFDKNVGLVITSPPYPNAYEYWLYHKYRMWWLGFDPIKVRTYEIGARPHYQKKDGQTAEDFRKQMSNVFDLLTEILIVGGHVCFVVGRSIIKGTVVDNAKLICDVADEHGLTKVADIEREIASVKKSFNLKYGKIKTESILIFIKDK